MAWASNGNQTGTDTNLSGLTGVTGTTTFVLPSGITVYQVPSQLAIFGTLSWDPNTEWLWSTRSDGNFHIAIASGASLTVNGTITGNGPFNRRNPALLFTGSIETLAVSNAENTGDLVVNSGGTLSLTGIRMQQASHVFYLAGSIVTINDCILEATVDGSSGTTGRRIRNFTASTIANCIFNGVAYDAFNASATLTNPLWESVYYAVECVSDLGFGGDNNVYTVASPNIRASVFDIGNFAGAKISVTNLNSGVKLRAYHLYHLDNGQPSQPTGATKVLNSLNITAVNTAQAGVNTPSLFCRDTNNGNRVSITYRDSSVESFTADRTYFATGNSSGVFSVLQVLAYVVYGGRTPTSSSSPPVYDFRDTTGSEANLFNFIFACYGFLPTVAVINVSGLNSAARSVGQTLLTDSKITQATRATVAAYTSGQSTFSADKLYDYSAYDKTLSTGIEQPANAATRWAEDSGSSILISSAYELIVNSSLSGISVNHSTRKISISPLAAGTTFPGGIRLTNIELVNAGTQSVPVSVLASGIVKVADGTTNLTAWTFASGTTINLRSGATAATVQVSSTSGITAGSGVTLTAPVASTVISGLPHSNNANGIAPAPVLGIYDASDGSFIAAYNTSDAEYTGTGQFTILAADYAGSLTSGTSIQIRGDAVGWRRTAAISINTASPPATLDLSAAFSEYVDESGNAIVGLSAATTGLNYDQPNTRFELNSASGGASSVYDFAGTVYRQEILTSNKAGLENFNSTAVRAIQYISNQAYKRIILPAGLTVAAAPAAATSPIISDFVVLAADDSDPFEHGLASTASGLTDRPEVRINFQAPTAAGDAPTATEIRSEIDSNSTQLAAIVAATTAIKGAGFDTATDSLTELSHTSTKVIRRRD